MADTTKGNPQAIAPQVENPADAKKVGRRLAPGSAFTEMGKTVRSFINEKLFKPQKPHGGIR